MQQTWGERAFVGGICIILVNFWIVQGTRERERAKAGSI